MKKFIFFILIFISVVFHSWLVFYPLSSGDWSFNFSESISKFYVYPFVWNTSFNYGMGDSIAFILSLETYFLSTVHILNSIFRLPWILIERIISFWPYLFISVFTPAYLFKKMFPQNKFWIFSSLIFLINTYALMLVGGGQMGVAMGYALAPLVLCAFINVIDLRLKTYDLRAGEKSFLKSYILRLKSPLVAGLTLALQVMFDARIAYVTMVAVGIYFVINELTSLRVNGLKQFFDQRLLRQSFRSFLAMTGPIVIAVLLHFFWILPLVLAGQNPISELGSAYSSSAAVKFLSFADFSHAISLLHPNWPENIFGKVYFLQPEFLLLPILAFSSLLFVHRHSGERSDTRIDSGQARMTQKNIWTSQNDRRVNTVIIFFVLLGLIGTFLAKGANPPFGEIYIWLFKYLPGFVMFRDPAKWYTLIAISYSVLIPFSVWNTYEWLRLRGMSKIKKLIPTVFLLSVVCSLLFLIRPAILGQLSGTFKARSVPAEYIELKDFLYSQPQFFRTLWVPTTQRFGFSSNNHPEISGQGIFKVNDTTGVIKQLSSVNNEQFLQDLGVKYVIVPFDSEGEIFLKERKYDNEQYKNTIAGLEKISWLRKINDFGKIAVFEMHPPTGGPKDHFFINGLTSSRVHPESSPRGVNGLMINPTKYEVQVQNVQKGEILVFSESYNSGWKARVENKSSVKEIATVAYGDLAMTTRLNSFVLPESGSYTLEVYYEPQKWVNIGLVVSVGTLILCILFLAYTFRGRA